MINHRIQTTCTHTIYKIIEHRYFNTNNKNKIKIIILRRPIIFMKIIYGNYKLIKCRIKILWKIDELTFMSDGQNMYAADGFWKQRIA